MRMRGIRHIPNLLTLSRALLCPVIITLFLRSKFSLALILFFLACLSDLLDGYVARKFGATSKLGGVLDPLCDKLFTGTFFSLLMIMGACPSWFLGLYFSVNVLQLLGLALLKFPGNNEPETLSPLRSGKLNTAFQMIWMFLLLADLSARNFTAPSPIVMLGYAFLGSMQILVFFRYFFHFRVRLARSLAIPTERLTTIRVR